MKKNLIKSLLLAVCMVALLSVEAVAQTKSDAATTTTATKAAALKTYLIERDIPGASALTPPDLKGISQKSCAVIKQMGPGIQWVQSYIAGNKVFCVYKAENEAMLREHAKKGGFPITSIMEINGTISPATAGE